MKEEKKGWRIAFGEGRFSTHDNKDWVDIKTLKIMLRHANKAGLENLEYGSINVLEEYIEIECKEETSKEYIKRLKDDIGVYEKKRRYNKELWLDPEIL